ncbi:MAG: hypothetical protein CME06_05330 [Gemmatimonadetes bacterium]|nr:hypothetical protein [Gemmatimonadota bacterium]
MISRAADVLGVIDRTAKEIDPDAPHVEESAERIQASSRQLRLLLDRARELPPPDSEPRRVAPPERRSDGSDGAGEARFEIGVPRGDRPEQVAQDAAVKLAGSIEADLVFVAELDSDGESFRQLGRASSHPRHGRGDRAEETIEASRGILRNACRNREPEIVVDAWNDARYQRRQSVTSQNIRSVMAAPLIDRGGEVFGVIYADRRGIACKPFGASTRRAFERLVESANDLINDARERSGGDRSGTDLAEIRLRATRPILGDSETIEEARQLAAAFAATHAPVLITGERGTGKELFARALHEMSPWHGGRLVRLQGPFLVGDTGNAEIRGWKKGAFTGAIESQPGAFEQAADGTVFIDEVADLDPKAQAALLVALDPGVVRRLGETESRMVTARVIAATNRDLHTLAAEGEFRRDLLDRLSALELRLPPLRERRSDLLLLFWQFVASTDLPLESRPDSLSPDAERWLMAHPLEGNVRELKNLATRSCVMATYRGSTTIERDDLADDGKPAPLMAWPQFRRAILDAAPPEERDGELGAWLEGWHAATGGSRKRMCEQACLSDTRLRTLIREAGAETSWASAKG